MILEELFGSFVSLFSSSIIQTPTISRENLQRECTLIFDENPDEVYDGLIHREYDEQVTPTELPYYEDDVSVLVQTNDQPGRKFFESFRRSCKANIGLIIVAVFILGLLTIGVVLVYLKTTDACKEWATYKNLPNMVVLQIVAYCVGLLPLFSWFPVCIAMLLGFKEFQKNYLLRLFVLQLIMGTISCLYSIYIADKFTGTNVADYSKYR